MIQTLHYTPNQKVLEEIEAIEATRRDLIKMLDEADRLTEYCSPFLSSCAGQEFLDKVAFSHPIKILDIGFGRGETSLYLSAQGHEVHAVEPSPLNCEILHCASLKYGQKIHVYQGTAESFGQIHEHGFDLCLFNSSLHHCDDPCQVLQICQSKLKQGGQILAINEPLLKFYQSKKWYYETLEKDPVSLGHYGGNEHIYYYREYISFFKRAGFSSVEGLLHVKNRQPRFALQEALQKKIGNQYVVSDFRLLLKFSILLMLKNLWAKPLIDIGKKLSLFPYSFKAIKHTEILAKRR